MNAEKEIDFIVPDEKLAIQVSYSIKDETTYNREVPPLVKYAKAHEDWKCLLIIAFCPYIFVITTADDDNNNNNKLNDNKYEKKD